MDYETYGRHVVTDVWGVAFNKLNSASELSQKMVEFVERAGATVLSVQLKQFKPQGATVLILLTESHFSIHTYPEKGFASMDCYTCGDTVDPNVAIELMLAYLNPEKSYSKTISRGQGELTEQIDTL